MESETSEFAAHWDANVWMITLGVSALLIGCTILFVWLGQHYISQSAVLGVIFYVVAVQTVFILLAMVLFAPRKYAISPHGMVIKRLGPDATIPAREICGVRRQDVSVFYRLFGVGGAFGHYGLFRDENVGSFRAYMTRTDSLVLIERRDAMPVAISPDDPDEAIRAIRKAILPDTVEAASETNAQSI